MGGGGVREEHVRGISELSTVFTVIFVITLLALLAQLLYILLRRRQSSSSNAVSYAAPSPSSSSSSKEQLLYFFGVRAARNSSNDSNNSPVQTGDSNNECPISSSVELGMSFVDVDVLKLHGVFGPPRFLFTIEEEDDEEARAEEDDSGSNVRVLKRVMSLKQCFDAADHDVEGGGRNGGGGTPFSTPCGSPAFFTPVDSPVHEAVTGGSRDEEMGLG